MVVVVDGGGLGKNVGQRGWVMVKKFKITLAKMLQRQYQKTKFGQENK